jgi:1A family penicillin-binding protein
MNKRIRKKRHRWDLPHRKKRRRGTSWSSRILATLLLPFRAIAFSLRLLLRARSALKILLIIAIVAGVLAIASLALAVGWVSRTLPDPDNIATRRVAESTRIFDRTGDTLLYEIFTGERRTHVSLQNIPSHVKWATIIVEDQDFYSHRGFDIRGLARAVFVNIMERRRAQGGSTITQQFIKNAVLTHEKTYARKLKEFILAFEIERRFSKDEILEMYLNEISYGGPNHGVESASVHYFGKSVGDISIAEGAVLAALPNAPTYYSPYGSNRDALIERQQFILKRMQEEQYITTEEYTTAKREELLFKPRDENILAPHFSLWIREQLAERYGERRLIEGGLTVTTSLDLDKQRIAEDVIADLAPDNAKNFNASNAALVALDAKTGHVLAMVGSRDYFDEDIDGNVNVALRARQPGSSFKPIVYTAAFEKGYTPETLLFDVETVFPTDVEGEYIPKNYDLSERGAVTMRKALQGSLNIPAVKTIYLTGIGRVLDFAERVGYTTLSDRSRFGLSLVLGGGEVTLLEHTATYATFARSGIYHAPVSILKVEDRDGNIIEEWRENAGARVIDEQIARMTNNVLSDNAARAYVFGERNPLMLPERPVAAKTGTTNDYRDAWTVGYTPSLAVGVWGGNNDNSEMVRGAGGSKIAAPIWNAFMRRALTGTPIEEFRPPDPLDIESPVLRGEGLGAISVQIDRATGKRATTLTPETFIEERTYNVLKPILHFIDKDAPRAGAPSDPGRDPHYEFWLRSIEAWATRTGIGASAPPTEMDDLHVPENIPIISLVSPSPGTSTRRGDPLSLSVAVSAPRGVMRVEYWIDDTRWTTVSSEPYTFTGLLNPNMEPGEHALTARAYDDIDNMGEMTIRITVTP